MINDLYRQKEIDSYVCNPDSFTNEYEAPNGRTIIDDHEFLINPSGKITTS